MNDKKRTIATITAMTIFAVVILVLYFYWSNRTQPLKSSEDNLTEVQQLIKEDLELYYPETPREVVKLFARMMKVLYNTQEEEEIKALALKIRKLYDQEFLDSNPEETYLVDLNTDLAKWKKNNRKITNYLLAEKKLNQESEMEGVKYFTQNVSFTIQERSKFTETWNVLLRQDANNKWKILGWKPVSDQDTKELFHSDYRKNAKRAFYCFID